MLEQVYSFFEKLLNNFTWTRLTFTLVILAILIGSLVGFETYTSHFKLNRISNEAKILEQLVAISEKVKTKDKHTEELLDKSFTSLVTSYNSLFNSEYSIPTISGQLTAVNPYRKFPWFSKSLYILLPWALLSFIFMMTMKSGMREAISGVIVIALVFIFIGNNLPEFSDPRVIRWVYPWGTMLATIALILIFDKKNKKLKQLTPP